ncbi:hypothetical protein BMASAVP1_A1450 [Burkholderia mallei SAVP1]|nr:hypothetical protein BMASAVP1_A1450 [Burkholderia mallei SAVP1]
MKPIVATRCGRARASASTRSHSPRSSDSGFSQNTCLPARNAATIWSACSADGVTSQSASSSGSAASASKSS